MLAIRYRVAFAISSMMCLHLSTTTFTTPNQDPSVLAAGATYDAMLTISSDPIESNAEFTIVARTRPKSHLDCNGG